MVIHRKRGRPGVDEDATTHRATLRIPLPLWEEVQRLAAEKGLTTHAWMREALDAQVKDQKG